MNRFQEYLADEFAEDYEEGRLSRREALKLIAAVSGSMVLASSILAACTPPETDAPAAAPGNTSPPEEAALPSASETPASQVEESSAPGTVSPDDPAITAGFVQFPGNDEAPLSGYIAYPAEQGPFPVVLVCHENRGLTAHIQDVTRRLARAGYVGLAIDLLSRQGGTDEVSSSNVPGVLGSIDPQQFVEDFLSGWQYLGEQDFAQAARVGMVGFCFGGGVTWLMATRMPELKAAVPYYGPHPPVEDVPAINAPVLGIYGERDQRITQGVPAIEAAMIENQKIFEKVIYPNADHAFHNDTGSRYMPEAATDAWQRTLAWFAEHL